MGEQATEVWQTICWHLTTKAVNKYSECVQSLPTSAHSKHDGDPAAKSHSLQARQATPICPYNGRLRMRGLTCDGISQAVPPQWSKWGQCVLQSWMLYTQRQLWTSTACHCVKPLFRPLQIWRNWQARAMPFIPNEFKHIHQTQLSLMPRQLFPALARSFTQYCRWSGV